jgi:hypothetical protein
MSAKATSKGRARRLAVSRETKKAAGRPEHATGQESTPEQRPASANLLARDARQPTRERPRPGRQKTEVRKHRGTSPPKERRTQRAPCQRRPATYLDSVLHLTAGRPKRVETGGPAPGTNDGRTRRAAHQRRPASHSVARPPEDRSKQTWRSAHRKNDRRTRERPRVRPATYSGASSRLPEFIAPMMRSRSSIDPNSTTIFPLRRPRSTLTFVSYSSDSSAASS